MIVIKHIVAITLVFGFLLCEVKVSSQEAGFLLKKSESVSDQEYYFAFTEATKFYLFGNYVQAVNLYRECLKIKPKSGAVHYQLAKIFMNAGNTNLAKEHAKLACQFSVENKWYLQELADIYKIEQKYDSAIIVYKQLLVYDPENISNIFNIATLLERTGKLDEALLFLNIIDGKIGLSKEVSVSRYRIYNSKKLDNLALEQLKQALKLSDNEYSINGMIAEYFRSHNEPDSAYAYYNKIYPDYKDDQVVVFSLAEFLLELGRVDSAKRMLLEVMNDSNIENMTKSGYFYKILQNESLLKLTRSILDTLVGAYYQLYYDDIRSISIFSDIEYRIGNYGKAAAALKRIIFMDDSNYQAFEQLIFCENALGNPDSVLFYSDMTITKFGDKPVPFLLNGSAKFQKAEYVEASSVLEKGLALTDNTGLKIEFYTLLAECYESMNQFEKSVLAFTKALEIDRENVAIKNNYAYYLSLRDQNLTLAEEMSKFTIEREPDNPTYLDTYAWVLFKMKKFRVAKKYITRALTNGGEKNSEILMHYAEILICLKEYEQALVYLNLVIKQVEETKREGILNRIKEVELLNSR